MSASEHGRVHLSTKITSVSDVKTYYRFITSPPPPQPAKMTHHHPEQKETLLLHPITIPSTSITIEQCPLTSSSSPYSETTETILQNQPKCSSKILLKLPKKVVVQYLSIFLLVSLVGMGIFASTVHNGPWSALEEEGSGAAKTLAVQAAIPPCPCSSNSAVETPTIPAAQIETTKLPEIPKISKKSSPKKPKPKVQFHMRMFP